MVTHNRVFAEEFAPTHVLRVADGRASMRLCIAGEVRDSDFWENAAANPATQQRATAESKATKAQAGGGTGGDVGGRISDRKKAQKAQARLDKVLDLVEAAEARAAAMDAEVAAAFEKRDSATAERLVAEKARLEAEIEKLFAEAEELEVVAATMIATTTTTPS